jgi:hypothetical protein
MKTPDEVVEAVAFMVREYMMYEKYDAITVVMEPPMPDEYMRVCTYYQIRGYNRALQTSVGLKRLGPYFLEVEQDKSSTGGSDADG